MSVDYRARIVVGVKLQDLCEFSQTEVTETRYNPMTGEKLETVRQVPRVTINGEEMTPSQAREALYVDDLDVYPSYYDDMNENIYAIVGVQVGASASEDTQVVRLGSLDSATQRAVRALAKLGYTGEVLPYAILDAY